MSSTTIQIHSEEIVKRYVSPNEAQLLGIRLGKKIMADIEEFKPTWMIALWRGGAPFGMVVQGLLEANGVKVDHIAVRTSSYTAPGEQNSTVLVHGLDYVVEKCNANDKVLIVDDVFESGRSIKALLDKMRAKMRQNMPADIRIAAAFWKPEKNKTDLIPHYVGEETSEWLVFGHEFGDLNGVEEIRALMGYAVADAYA